MPKDSRSLTAPGVVCEAANRELLKVYERQAMQTYESLKHTTWDCKYHVEFIPKCRRKVLYQGLRRELGEGFRSLAEWWECKVEEERDSHCAGICWAAPDERFSLSWEKEPGWRQTCEDGPPSCLSDGGAARRRSTGRRNPGRCPSNSPPLRPRCSSLKRQKWRTSWPASSNRSAGISSLPTCWSGRGSRCPFRIYRNEIRKSAWTQHSGKAAPSQPAFVKATSGIPPQSAQRASVVANWVSQRGQ
jgi:hypothetical protein